MLCVVRAGRSQRSLVNLGRDRKTIRAHLNGENVPGERRQSPDAFVPYSVYCQQRLADAPHLWTSTLFDEIAGLG
ncbi:hypothetical protein ACFYYM_31660 [Streptomyces erythrochromogenes]|uniref:hypothetical protein n=1 Tax=Streptomyces erythrochromogenes TaxID=285574 RepID=UPI0036C0B128